LGRPEAEYPEAASITRFYLNVNIKTPIKDRVCVMFPSPAAKHRSNYHPESPKNDMPNPFAMQKSCL